MMRPLSFVLLAFLAPATAANAQGSRALSAEDVAYIASLWGPPAEVMAEVRTEMVRERCISFRPDDAAITRLRAAGATDAFIGVVRSACRTPPASSRRFSFQIQGGPAGRRDWSTQDGQTWLESYPNGTQSVFALSGPGGWNGARGIVVYATSSTVPGAVLGTRIFIPDPGQTPTLYYQLPGGRWQRVAEIVEN
jgi:hypothetical protein